MVTPDYSRCKKESAFTLEYIIDTIDYFCQMRKVILLYASVNTKRKTMITGQRIKAVREARGLTLEELANQSKVSKATLWRSENGKTLPEMDTLQKLAATLEVSASYLSGESDALGDRYAEADLSDLERGLLVALREGRITDALDSFRALLPGSK